MPDELTRALRRLALRRHDVISPAVPSTSSGNAAGTRSPSAPPIGAGDAAATGPPPAPLVEEPGTPFEAALAARLRSVEADLAEVRGRVNGLLFVVAGAAVTQIVARLLS